MTTKPAELGPPRWRGQPHRLEVWYATFTDPRTTDGYWLHHEVVAPDEGTAYAHGWCAVFPVDGPPRAERFGPAPPSPTSQLVLGAGARVDGRAARRCRATSLGTSPTRTVRAAVHVPRVGVGEGGAPRVADRAVPHRAVRGHRLRRGPDRRPRRAPSARWPASTATATPSGGAGCTPTSVAATCSRWWRARRASAGPVAIPPVPLVQLRLDGDDWPDDSVKAAARARARVALPHWSVKAASGHRRLLVDVTVPPDASVALGLHRPRRRHCDVHEQRAGRRRDRGAALGRRLARRPPLVVARHGPRRGRHARPLGGDADDGADAVERARRVAGGRGDDDQHDRRERCRPGRSRC